MKPSMNRFSRYCRFLVLSLLLMLVSFTLSSCGEESSTSPAVSTYAAGSFCFDNAIDAEGNIWVANGGNGTPGTDQADSNVQIIMGVAKGPQYFPYSGPQWPGAE